MTSDQPRRPPARLRGGTLFTEKRSNAWSALVGFYVGRGRLAPQIASILHDGTTGETIRRLIDSWGLPKGRRREAAVPVQLSAARRRKLLSAAKVEQCSPEELVRRLVVAALDQKLVGGILHPPVAVVIETRIPRGDGPRLMRAVDRLPVKEQAKVLRRINEIDIFERSDGKVRWELRAA